MPLPREGNGPHHEQEVLIMMTKVKVYDWKAFLKDYCIQSQW